MKKALPWAALIVAVVWIMHDPAHAAATVQQLLSGLTTFVTRL